MTGRTVSIWMSPEEEAKIKERAREDKRTVSNFVKVKLFEEVKK